MNIQPYIGSDKYIFISYAHKDKESIYSIIERMISDNYRVWYDEGIDPGTEWDENIAEHVEKSDLFIAFISNNYLDSDNCKDELNYARDLKKSRLLVYIEPDVVLPKGMAMRLNRIQSIHKYTYTDEEQFYKKLYSTDKIDMFKSASVDKNVENVFYQTMHNIAHLNNKEFSMLGKLVKQRYWLNKGIYSSYQSEVYLADDFEDKDKPVIIKIYSNQYITSINFFAKTSDKSLSDDILKMEQKSLAKVYDIGYDVFTQKHFMVQQYIEGNTLEDFLNDEFIGGRSVHGIAFLKIFIQILDALSYMHSFGIYCGDVQPKNIVVTKKDVVTNEHRCYLVDFSESGYFGQIPPEKTVILSKYRVPKNSFDARSDIYQAGILLDELLSRMGNLLPWNLADDFMRFKRKMFDVVSKAAAKNPDYRYSSVEEFKKDIEDIIMKY